MHSGATCTWAYHYSGVLHACVCAGFCTWRMTVGTLPRTDLLCLLLSYCTPCSFIDPRWRNSINTICCALLGQFLYICPTIPFIPTFCSFKFSSFCYRLFNSLLLFSSRWHGVHSICSPFDYTSTSCSTIGVCLPVPLLRWWVVVKTLAPVMTFRGGGSDGGYYFIVPNLLPTAF